MIVFPDTTIIHSNLTNDILISTNLKNKTKKKKQTWLKERQLSIVRRWKMEEKRSWIFSFENYGFCLEENKHSFTLPIRSKRRWCYSSAPVPFVIHCLCNTDNTNQYLNHVWGCQSTFNKPQCIQTSTLWNNWLFFSIQCIDRIHKTRFANS